MSHYCCRYYCYNLNIILLLSLLLLLYYSVKETNVINEQPQNSTTFIKIKRDKINHDDSINTDVIINKKSKRVLKIPRTFTKDQIAKESSSSNNNNDDDDIMNKFKYHDHYDSDGKKINDNNGQDNHIIYINNFTTTASTENQKDDSDINEINDDNDNKNMDGKSVSFNLNNDIVNSNNHKHNNSNNNSSDNNNNNNENSIIVSGNNSPGSERPVSPVGLSRRTTAVKFKTTSTSTGVGK